MDKEQMPIKTEALEEEFGLNKSIPQKHERAILKALVHYPELRTVPIVFKEATSLLPLSCKPTIPSLLTLQKPRTYKITISTRSLPGLASILFKNYSFNAQVGIIGHELAHIVDYENATQNQLLTMGIKYPFSNFRKRLERSTDLRTIQHGLGWELYAWSCEIRKQEQKSNLIKYHNQFYLTPEEILPYIQQNIAAIKR